MPPLHRRSDCASERRLPLTDDDIYWAGGKTSSSFHLALPSRSQTFSRIYLTSSAFVRPCSTCYVCSCGGAAAAVLVFAKWMRKGIRGRCFEGTSSSSFSSSSDRRRFIPSFRPNAKCRADTNDPVAGRQTDGGGNRVCGQFIANPMQEDKWPPACPVTCVIHNTVSSDSAHFPFSVSQSSLG